jgi:hypothetical protein
MAMSVENGEANVRGAQSTRKNHRSHRRGDSPGTDRSRSMSPLTRILCGQSQTTSLTRWQRSS